MNIDKELTFYILKYIFKSFGIIENLPSQYYSIKNNNFILNSNLFSSDIFIEENKQTNLYGASIVNDLFSFRICCADVSSSEQPNSEFVLICQIENLPFYGCYIDLNNKDKNLICYSTDDNFVWISASILVQGNFLSGLENLKNTNTPIKKLEEFKDLEKGIKSLIFFYEDLYYPAKFTEDDIVISDII